MRETTRRGAPLSLATPTVHSGQDSSRRTAHRPLGPEAAGRSKVDQGLVRAALRVVERRCVRRTCDGHLVGGAPHGEVALALRDLLAEVEDAEFDQCMAAVERACVHISTTESAHPEDWEAYSVAAWEANIDPDDAFVPSAEPEDMWLLHHRAVIQHWDLELRKAVEQLVCAALCSRRHAPSAPDSHHQRRVGG